jgi:MraZ protein
VDAKGRLALPVNFRQFMGDEKLYLTSLDTRIGRVYKLSVWKQNEKVLSEERDNPEWAEDLLHLANHYGADGEVDAQGRVLLPTTLRRELELEDQQVYLEFTQNAVSIYNDKIYKELQSRARANLAEKLNAMKKKGIC